MTLFNQEIEEEMKYQFLETQLRYENTLKFLPFLGLWCLIMNIYSRLNKLEKEKKLKAKLKGKNKSFVMTRYIGQSSEFKILRECLWLLFWILISFIGGAFFWYPFGHFIPDLPKAPYLDFSIAKEYDYSIRTFFSVFGLVILGVFLFSIGLYPSKILLSNIFYGLRNKTKFIEKEVYQENAICKKCIPIAIDKRIVIDNKKSYLFIHNENCEKIIEIYKIDNYYYDKNVIFITTNKTVWY